jgi:cytochrome bd ubiquinol oxidase subunit I
LDTLFSARALMGLSLFFHTLFTPIGIGMPMMLFAAEGIGLKTGDERYRRLARAWTPVVGLFFAVGALSGTILSFELGLLWPRFMEYAGGIIGMPFSLEGFAFFTEAIFLAVYIYGWNRLSSRAHWLASIPLFISAAISAVFVISANAWMNEPEGFDIVGGKVVNVNPWDAMFNAAWLHEAIHGTLSAYVTTGFAVAGVYAILALKGRRNGQLLLGMKVGMAMAAIAIPLQLVSGDYAARKVAADQPLKFAAMESLHTTEAGAPIRIGGIPSGDETRFAIEIPKALSFLAHDDFNATVTGLDSAPPADRPPVFQTHLSFDVMVGCGFAMLAIAAWYWWLTWRRRAAFDPGRWLLRALAVAGVLGFIATETGWFVTEFGRQPWVVRGFLRTADGATTEPGIDFFFVLFTLVYMVIAGGLGFALLRWPRTGGSMPVPPPPEDEIGDGRLASGATRRSGSDVA